MSTEPSSESAALLLKACARCAVADVSLAAAVLEKDPLLVHSARGERGRSPLHLACAAGCREMVDLLLDNGTPWNVVDDDYISAGDLARENGHAELYAFLVERGVQTEMLLKVLEQMDVDEDEEEELEADGAEVEAEAAEDGTAVLPEGTEATKTDEFTLPNPTFVNGRLLQPRSKPGTGTDLDEYLAQDVKYEDDHGRLLDAQGNAIEMEWERIIMEKHAEVIAPEPGLSVMNVGFGMGMVDFALQSRQPRLHTICEAHPTVLKRIQSTDWVQKAGDKIVVRFGKWQDTLAEDQNVEPFDGIFFDTFSEIYETSLVPFHRDYLPRLLRKPDPSKPGDRGGIYSAFNGLASGNVFFHDVACRILEIDLADAGFETEWVEWDFGGPEGETSKALGDEEGKAVWKDVRYDYWRLGKKYRCPIVRWKREESA